MPCPQSGAHLRFLRCQASDFDGRSPPTSGKVMILYAGVASSKHSAPTGRDAYLAQNAPCWNQTGQTVHVAALSMNKAARFANQPRYIIVSVFSLKWTLAVPASWEKIRGYGSCMIDIHLLCTFKESVYSVLAFSVQRPIMPICRSGHLPVSM